MTVSFFCRSSAKDVWKSVTGVSAAGSKRGRGKGTGRAVRKDFNKGQEIGEGKMKLVLPGFNAQLNLGTKIEVGGENLKYEEKLAEARKEMNNYRTRFREHPLDRGWSGRKSHGRSAGQPDDYNDTEFKGFSSKVLMLKPIWRMSGILGRVRKMEALVVVGNGNGLGGFCSIYGNDPKATVRHARNKATQLQMSIPRFENRTVMHDFFSRYLFSTVFVSRKPKGHGVKAHRVIQAICETIGIEDLYVKVEGNVSNPVNITKAFFLGLINQRKYEDMAEEKQLHLVDVGEENFNYPILLASPKSRVRTDFELSQTGENLNFIYYIYENRIKTIEPPRKNIYEDGPTWYRYLDKIDYGKNREKTKLLLAAKYGDTKVLDVFPYFKTIAKSFNDPQ